jgi:hypothetical protein
MKKRSDRVFIKDERMEFVIHMEKQSIMHFSIEPLRRNNP